MEIQIELWNRLGLEGHRFARSVPADFSAAALAATAAPAAVAANVAADTAGLSKLIFGGSLSVRGVLVSTSPEVGASEMSSSSVKSSGVPPRGSGLTAGGTENTCVSLARSRCSRRRRGKCRAAARFRKQRIRRIELPAQRHRLLPYLALAA